MRGIILPIHRAFKRQATMIAQTLLPAMPVDGGFAGQPEERAAEVMNLQTA